MGFQIETGPDRWATEPNVDFCENEFGAGACSIAYHGSQFGCLVTIYDTPIGPLSVFYQDGIAVETRVMVSMLVEFKDKEVTESDILNLKKRISKTVGIFGAKLTGKVEKKTVSWVWVIPGRGGEDREIMMSFPDPRDPEVKGKMENPFSGTSISYKWIENHRVIRRPGMTVPNTGASN